VLQTTMALTALSRGDDRTEALRDTLSEVLSIDEPRTRLAGMISALDIHYDLGEGHPLLGRRMPDLDVASGTRWGHCSRRGVDSARRICGLGGRGHGRGAR
jgi:hypothetical protein